MYEAIDIKIRDFFNSQQAEPFQWGVRDCSTFAADWVQSFTGNPVLQTWPSYSDEAGAVSALHTLGFNTQEEALDHYFTRLADKRRLMRGDLVGYYFPNQDLMAIGVNTGEYALFRSLTGIYKLPHKRIPKNLCWRIV